MQRAVANGIVKMAAEQGIGPGRVGTNWTTRFRNRFPELLVILASCLNRQRAYASYSSIIQDHFMKVGGLIMQKVFKIFNIDEKGFLLVVATTSKLVVRTCRWNPRVTQDGNRELISLTETVCTAGYPFPAFTVMQGAAQHLRWHTSVNTAFEGNRKARLEFSSTGWSDKT